MSATRVEVEGTLQADGTLVLDTRPDLPPGRVRVAVQPLLDYTQTDIWKFFERLHAEQKARGFVPRSKEQVDAEIAAARQEDEERALALERLQEESWRLRQGAEQARIAMIVYLDTNIVIYAVESTPSFGIRAQTRIASVQVVSITAAVCDRAALIRATMRFKPMDALQLAAAVEHGANIFLTNDTRLSRFTDLTVEVLA